MSNHTTPEPTVPAVAGASNEIGRKRTPLFERLKKFGGKWVDYAGWDMPVSFCGIVEEHRTVRQAVGLFDLTHMGELELRAADPADALAFANRIVTADVSRLEPGQAAYCAVCNEAGGIKDDVIVYRLAAHVMVVVNASNREKMVRWFRSHAPSNVEVVDASDEIALIALQGPLAARILAPLASIDVASIGYYHFAGNLEGEGRSGPVTVAGVPCIVSRTGYTGEDGFELYVANHNAVALYDAVYEAASGHGVLPIGLGARDTLRLEARYALYGNELDESVNPLEAGLGWVVKLDKSDFIGREALLRIKQEGPRRVLVGLQMEDRGIPRHGFDVLSGGQPVGTVTSGTMSPTLGVAIALAFVAKNEQRLNAVGSALDVVIRNNPCRALVVKTPFHRGSVKS